MSPHILLMFLTAFIILLKNTHTQPSLACLSKGKNACEDGPCLYKEQGYYTCIDYSCQQRNECTCNNYCMWYSNNCYDACKNRNAAACVIASGCKLLTDLITCVPICSIRDANNQCTSDHGCQISGIACSDI